MMIYSDWLFFVVVFLWLFFIPEMTIFMECIKSVTNFPSGSELIVRMSEYQSLSVTSV